MTQDDIIRMAREAGLQQRHATPTEWWCWEGSIERFFALVAAAEREACAKVCVPYVNSTNDGIALVALNIHDAIRARGEK